MKKISILLVFTFITGLSFAQFNKDSAIASAKHYQDELNAEYGNPQSSPLDSADLVRFLGLKFYPVNPDYCVVAKFRRTKKEKKFKMKTSTDRLPVYIKYGEVSFILNGAECKLNVYRNIELSKKKEFKNYLFLPFTDLTNGETTYGGGRYIDLTIPGGETIMIDFNKAYNPYCAYTHRYSCPVPPSENFLNIKVEAGVMEGLKLKYTGF